MSVSDNTHEEAIEALTTDRLAYLIRWVDWEKKLSPEELAKKMVAFISTLGLSIQLAPVAPGKPNSEEQ